MNGANGEASKKNDKNDRHQQTHNDDTSPTTTTSTDDVSHWFSLSSNSVGSFVASESIRRMSCICVDDDDDEGCF